MFFVYIENSQIVAITARELVPDGAAAIEMSQQALEALLAQGNSFLYTGDGGIAAQRFEQGAAGESAPMTTEEATLDMLVDMDYRLGLLELGEQTKEGTV